MRGSGETVDRQPNHAPPARDLGLTPTIPTEVQPAPRAVDSATSPPERECPLCDGTGVMRWTQMCPDGVLRELEHPCVDGCSGYWKHPAAQAGRVVETIDAEPVSE